MALVEDIIKNSKILIIDDETTNLTLLASLLSEQGFQILTAANGIQGLKIAESKMPDLILLDIQMPGMGGFDVCKELKNNNITKNIPVIFLTAFNDKDDIIKGFTAGAVDYITKPFNITELFSRMNVHLELKKSREQIIKQKDELANIYIQLLEQKVYFESLLENLPTAVIITDNTGKILKTNFAFTELFGYTFDEAFSKDIIDLTTVPDFKEEAKIMFLECKKGKIINKNVIKKRKDNTPVHLQFIGAPIIIDNNEIGVYSIYLESPQA